MGNMPDTMPNTLKDKKINENKTAFALNFSFGKKIMQQ